MSGKNLPERCSKSGAAYCAWQFPNVSMTLATDAKSYAERWSVKPGFLDPLHVTYCCIKRLKAATFVNVKYNSKTRSGEQSPDKSQLCPGLQIYLNPMMHDEQVSYHVKEHINSGSAENVAAVIRKYPCVEQVLLFLMKYLKERGPLMKFKYDTLKVHENMPDESRPTTANPRFLVNTFLTTLCEHELEFQAAVAIGDYLNFVIFVAYAHDLFWMKEVIVDTWGPLLLDFVNVGDKSSENLTPVQKASKIRFVMYRLIETIPWEKMKSQENFKITINPQINDSYLKRKATEAAHRMDELTKKPLNQPTLLTGGAGIMQLLGSLDPGEQRDMVDDPAAIAAREAEEQETKLKEEEKLKKAADELENQDFSFQYGYSPEHQQKHAPHGMCPQGFDPTITS